MADDRRLEPLTREEALRLLGGVSLGRVVFTYLALPAIRPVNHLVEGDRIIIRAHHGAAIVAGTDSSGIVVAYEADTIDPNDHLGWSVIVVGRARRLPEGDEAERFLASLQPWVAADSGDDIIVIQADMVDGFRLFRGGHPSR